MGYTENCCQLCAVSINVARMRTKNEPQSEGWGYSGGAYYSGDSELSQCTVFPEQSGCVHVKDGDELWSPWEHFPGRHCTFTGGYNGWKIGADEMKGMNLPRYIVRKPPNAKPEKDDEDYERISDFFVTSQTTSPPDDSEPGDLAYVRYGIDTFEPVNYEVTVELDFQGGERWGIPVHDACWKIFERISKMRTGEVDLEGFVALWAREACGECGFKNLKQEQVIWKCRQQWWAHEPGTEYLAANPHDIPGLILALQQIPLDQHLPERVFPLRAIDERLSSADTFSLLPTELKDMVLSHLSSKDISNLRLASRTFRQLPNRLFFRLIRDELPWFWEIDELRAACAEYRERLYNMQNPLLSQLLSVHAVRERELLERDMNWLEVYKKLCLLKKAMLGVRNRARIWTVVEEVVARIARLREKGWSQVEPTDEERESGLVNGPYCPRCNPEQIERRRS